MADIERLNEDVKKLRDTLPQQQKDLLDSILDAAADVSGSLEHGFGSFEPGEARMVLAYVNGKFVVKPEMIR
jgi:ABC-type transporter Mla subunit MlaD